MKNLIEEFQNKRKIPADYIKSEDLIKILGLKNVDITIFEDKINRFIKSFGSGITVVERVIALADILPEECLKDVKSNFAYNTNLMKEVKKETLSQLYL